MFDKYIVVAKKMVIVRVEDIHLFLQYTVTDKY